MLNILAHPNYGFSANPCPTLLEALPNTLYMCVKAIRLRSVLNRFHLRFTHSHDQQKQDSNKKHRHFIEVMKVWRVKLADLWAAAQPEESDHSQDGNTPPPQRSSLLFSSLSELNLDEDASEEEDELPEVHIEASQTTCTDDAIYGMEMEEENLHDFDDIVFVMQCLMFDLDELMKTVANEWLKVRHGESNYINASLAMIMAFRRVNKLTNQLHTQFPEIQSFDDFYSALMQPELERGQKRIDLEKDYPETTERLLEHLQFGTYPDGSLSIVMQTIAVYLRSFKSAIPDEKVCLSLQTGCFGPRYDEVLHPIIGYVEFSKRFLLEHLPLVYNETLLLNIFFHGKDGSGFFESRGTIRFALFQEAFEELRRYLSNGPNTKTLSIPLVFLVSAWYHSVQILQGGLLLSRITAITRKMLREVIDGMDKCEQLYRNDSNRMLFDLSLPKLRYLEDKSAYYRNHPFIAGVISLDVAVNISLFLGRVVTTFSCATYRMLHLYNAFVRGGGMAPVPLLEQVLDVHARAFFQPTRPSRNFMMVAERNTPGIVEATASKLYCILIDKDMSAVQSCTTFESLVTNVQHIWREEFYESKILAFNFIRLQDTLTPVLESVHDLRLPEIPLTDRVTFFLGLLEHHLKLPEIDMAMNIVSDKLRDLRPETFDLLPRVAGSMHLRQYGPLVERTYKNDSAQITTEFFQVMDVFERSTEPLSAEEITFVIALVQKSPAVLGLHDYTPGGRDGLWTGIMNHVAAGPRANRELLESLMQIDVNDVHGPVRPMHACAAMGNVKHLELLLSARNYAERDAQCRRAGNTTMHYAAKHGQLAVVEYLQKIFPDPTVRNNAGQTPFDLAKGARVKRLISEFRKQFDNELYRIQSRPESEARDNEEEWQRASDARTKRLHEKLNRRREAKRKEAEKTVTADDEENAKRAEEELMKMIEKDATQKGKKNKARGRKHRHGK